ncbi:MAG: DMT family transporter, partial [Planctomycetes bacterium]|nr:DMT family transporter [Planctomycetota bacterium]
ILVPVLAIWAWKQGHHLLGQKRFLLLMRGFLGTLGLFSFFYALKNLPLADTVIIFQAHPLGVALLAPWLLKEKNLRRHWVFLSISFIGVILVVGPTGAGSWQGRISAFICCILASFVYILVRYLRRTEATLTIALSFPVVSLVIFAPLFLLGFPGCEWIAPTALDWLFLVAMAVFAALGQVMMTLGLGTVPATRGTALSNLQVAFALIYGSLFFDEIPGWVTVAGAVVIVCAQLLLTTSRRETYDRRPTL